ncbi:MAG TPA: hypothetical protein DDX29_12145 [Clostridiales bacterium]|nr:hypothetical protein [Clostridiales bacterium]
MSEIKRYEAGLNGTAYMGMHEVPNGRYALYSDVIEIINKCNLAVKEIHDINDVVEFQKGAVKEAEQMDRESLISHYVCAVTNWAITLYERDKAEAELEAEREKVKYYHDKNQEKCAEIDTLRQELADLRGRLAPVEEVIINLREAWRDCPDEQRADRDCQSWETVKNLYKAFKNRKAEPTAS